MARTRPSTPTVSRSGSDTILERATQEINAIGARRARAGYVLALPGLGHCHRGGSASVVFSERFGLTIRSSVSSRERCNRVDRLSRRRTTIEWITVERMFTLYRDICRSNKAKYHVANTTALDAYILCHCLGCVGTIGTQGRKDLVTPRRQRRKEPRHQVRCHRESATFVALELAPNVRLSEPPLSPWARSWPPRKTADG